MICLPGRLLAALVLLACAVVPGSARAETYNTCAGFIDSLPATISTQGVWCLRKDLSTNVTSGNAITIATNNVIIDCNDFKIGGLAAGDASNTNGIRAIDRQNATVRNCNVRGFHRGVYLSGGAGHLVEDSRFDNNLYMGIEVGGDNNRVRRNAIYDTGGHVGTAYAYGIFATADVIDNTVAGVFAATAVTSPRGIHFYGTGNVARNNRVRGLQVSGNGGFTYGIYTSAAGVTVEGNQIAAPAGTNGWGIYGYSTTKAACSNNVISGFSVAMHACNLDKDAGGNTSL